MYLYLIVKNQYVTLTQGIKKKIDFCIIMQFSILRIHHIVTFRADKK